MLVILGCSIRVASLTFQQISFLTLSCGKKRFSVPGLVDRVFAFQREVEGLTTTSYTRPNNFSDLIDQDICTQCALSQKKNGFRVGVYDYSVTEGRWYCPPYQTSKIVHVHAKHRTEAWHRVCMAMDPYS